MKLTGSAMAATAGPAQTTAQNPAPATLRVGRVTVPLSVWVPLVIFALTRLYGFVIISFAARRQVALPSPQHPGIYQFSAHPASPGYLGLITNWDGQWYERIATLGYHLPSGPGGSGVKSALWTYAYLPGFPVLVGATMALTGLSFAGAVTIVNLAAGAGAMVVMFALLEPAAGRFVAGAAVLLTCCFVAAPLFQAAYSESLSLLLVCSVLLLISRRHYAWAVPVVVLLSLTRLVTPPVAIVMIVHAGLRFRHRAQNPIRRGEMIWMTVLAAVSAGSVSLWSTITSALNSESVATGASRGSVSNAVAVGRFGWFTNAYEHIGWIGVVALALLVVLLMSLALSPLTQTWGVEVRTWFAIYPIFLLFVAGVHTGMFRYLLLAFPLALLLIGSPRPTAIPRKRSVAVVIAVIVGLVLQFPWVTHALVVTQLAGKPWLP